MDACPTAAMVNLDSPPPPLSVREVLGTGQLPNYLVAAFEDSG